MRFIGCSLSMLFLLPIDVYSMNAVRKRPKLSYQDEIVDQEDYRLYTARFFGSSSQMLSASLIPQR